MDCDPILMWKPLDLDKICSWLHRILAVMSVWELLSPMRPGACSVQPDRLLEAKQLYHELLSRADEAEEMGERIQFEDCIYARFCFQRACRLRQFARCLACELQRVCLVDPADLRP